MKLRTILSYGGWILALVAAVTLYLIGGLRKGNAGDALLLSAQKARLRAKTKEVADAHKKMVARGDTAELPGAEDVRRVIDDGQRVLAAARPSEHAVDAALRATADLQKRIRAAKRRSGGDRAKSD